MKSIDNSKLDLLGQFSAIRQIEHEQLLTHTYTHTLIHIQSLPPFHIKKQTNSNFPLQTSNIKS